MNAVLIALTYVVQTLGVLTLIGVPAWFLLSPANPRAYDDATYWFDGQQITRADFDALRAQGHTVRIGCPSCGVVAGELCRHD